MTTTLWLAARGVGRTQAAIAHVVAARQQHVAAPIWVVVATERQRSAFRQHLLEADGTGVLFNTHIFTFTGLYAHLLAQAQQPTRRLAEAARLRLLRQVAVEVAQERGEQSVFGAVAAMPGFARALARLINVLKQSRIDPDNLRDAAQRAFGGVRAKDDELVAIYKAYQDVLRHDDLVDRDGEGWLALTILPDHPALACDVPLLVVDGFDTFTLLRADMLAALSTRAANVLITLVHAPADALAGRRFVAARAMLEAAHVRAGDGLLLHNDNSLDARSAPIRALALALFEPSLPPHVAQPGDPDADAVLFLEAPDEQAEVALALRAVKRHLLGVGGASPCTADDVLIVLRDWPRYAARLAAQCEAYGIPVTLHTGDTLLDNPAVATLLAALMLHQPSAGGVAWPHAALVDALRTPYLTTTGLPPGAATHLDQLACARHVDGGREAWLRALQATQMPAAPSQPLDEHMAAWFDALTPPPQATALAYVAWLDALIGPDPALASEDAALDDDNSASDAPVMAGRAPLIHVFARVRAQPDAVHASRDAAALHTLRHELRGMAGAHTLVDRMMRRDTLVRWEDFAEDLRDALAACAVLREPQRAGCVLVTDALLARGLPHAHVVVLGLAEGVFPQVAAEDPFYLDEECVALTSALSVCVPGASLPTLAERSEDDGIFYELLGLAQQTLTLSRPTVRDGAPWPESALWAAARIALPGAPLHALRPGAVVPPDEAASLEEWLVGVADALRGPARDRPQTVVGAYNALLAQHPQAWAHVHHARTVEARRTTRPSVPDAYSGQLQSVQALGWAAETFGTGAVWSASRLNDLALCAYGVFARRALHLDPWPVPQDGMTAQQRGTLMHSLLLVTYDILRRDDTIIGPGALDAALGALDQAWEHTLPDAPHTHQFRPSAAWAQEQALLRAQLEAWLAADFVGHDKLPWAGRPRRVLALEHHFGGATKTLIDAAGTPLHVQGTIDRVDVFTDDNTLLIIDYKLAELPNTHEIAEGMAVQTLLYRAVAQQLWVTTRAASGVADSVYWSVADPHRHQGLASIDANAVWTRVIERVEHARHGDFTALPANGPCRAECPWQALCRTQSMARATGTATPGDSHDAQ